MRTSSGNRIVAVFHRLNDRGKPTLAAENRFLHCFSPIISPSFRLQGTAPFLRGQSNPTHCSFRPIITIRSSSTPRDLSSSSSSSFLLRTLSTSSTTNKKEGNDSNDDSDVTRKDKRRKKRKTRSLQRRRNDDDNKKIKGILLYERDPESNFRPKIALTLSYFSSIYWTWYWVDFLPAINSSPHVDEHISPIVAYLGCAIGYTATVFSCSYARLAASKIVLVKEGEEEQQQDQKRADDYNSYNSVIQIYTHSLPFMLPSSQPLEEYRCGEIEFKRESDDTAKLETAIVQRNQANLSGHFPLKANNRRWPLWMFLTNMNDIKDQELLYEMLMIPSVGTVSKRTTSMRNKRHSVENEMSKMKPRKIKQRKTSKR